MEERSPGLQRVGICCGVSLHEPTVSHLPLPKTKVVGHIEPRARLHYFWQFDSTKLLSLNCLLLFLWYFNVANGIFDQKPTSFHPSVGLAAHLEFRCSKSKASRSMCHYYPEVGGGLPSPAFRTIWWRAVILGGQGTWPLKSVRLGCECWFHHCGLRISISHWTPLSGSVFSHLESENSSLHLPELLWGSNR